MMQRERSEANQKLCEITKNEIQIVTAGIRQPNTDLPILYE
jgi:hypothetical protein